jgi:hypothetical protein
MNWTVLNVGKHAGITLPRLIFLNPDYFYWALYESDIFDHIPNYELDYVTARAMSIKVPVINGIHQLVRYDFRWVRKRLRNGRFTETKRFDGLSFFNSPFPNGGYPRGMFLQDVIDLSFPYWVNHYNKMGYNKMIKDIKCIYYGSRSYYMTRRRCEEFFENGNNFV